MPPERLQYLYNRYQSGQLKALELQEWQDAIADLSRDAGFLSLIDADWVRDHSSLQELERAEKEAIYQYIINQQQKRQKAKIAPLWTRWRLASVVAAVVAFIVLGVYFMNYSSKETLKQAQKNVILNDVAPGKVGATLILSNGKQITLTDAANGELANEVGISITKAANGQLVYEIKESADEPERVNTLITAKGETYRVRLPDGSLVYLNAASSLTYSATLIQHGVRRVKLEGEGYFEISKDKAHPFVVESRGQEVKVLGTHFNVNAYVDEPAIATTLLEGSVSVFAYNEAQIIKPGEQAINSGNAVQVGKVNTESVTDWKNGDFSMDGVDFKTVMRKIARWYNVEIVFDPSLPDDIESGGWISRDNKLSVVLKLIESGGQVHFKVEGKKIYVSR